MTSGQPDRWWDVRGRVVVITGGASGIGKGMARHFASEGMHVVLADVEEGPLKATAAEIGAVPVVTDVRDLTSVRRLAEDTLRRFGKVDLLCNNAGVGPKCKIVDATVDDWRWLVEVNLMGVAHGLSAFLPTMKPQSICQQICRLTSRLVSKSVRSNLPVGLTLALPDDEAAESGVCAMQNAPRITGWAGCGQKRRFSGCQ